MTRSPMVCAIAAATACALGAIAAGPGTTLAWTLYCAEPLAALLGFAACRTLQRCPPAA